MWHLDLLHFVFQPFLGTADGEGLLSTVITPDRPAELLVLLGVADRYRQ